MTCNQMPSRQCLLSAPELLCPVIAGHRGDAIVSMACEGKNADSMRRAALYIAASSRAYRHEIRQPVVIRRGRAISRAAAQSQTAARQ